MASHSQVELVHLVQETEHMQGHIDKHRDPGGKGRCYSISFQQGCVHCILSRRIWDTVHLIVKKTLNVNRVGLAIL